MNYRDRFAALEARLLAAIEAWQRTGSGLTQAAFDELACDIFVFQATYNAPYARYAAAVGYTPEDPPRRADDIPAVPAAAFKEATLATFSPARAALHFTTSGTTEATHGHHYLETPTLYRAALLAGFDRAVLADGARLRYLNLVPESGERPTSSLGYMMRAVSDERGDGRDGWFLHGDDLDVDGFVTAVCGAASERQALCIAGTAFAFVALLEALAARGLVLAAPAGSRIMETGGFKGRTRVVGRDQLYADLGARLGVPRDAIVAEYGMTELCSQYYDSAGSRPLATRIKVAPPWLRPLVVGADGREVPHGAPGALRHLDLANLSSVCAIQTEDIGFTSGPGFVLVGRAIDAPERGCSLDAQELTDASARANLRG